MSENYTTKIFIEGDKRRYFGFLSFAAIFNFISYFKMEYI